MRAQFPSLLPICILPPTPAFLNPGPTPLSLSHEQWYFPLGEYWGPVGQRSSQIYGLAKAEGQAGANKLPHAVRLQGW